MEKGIKKISREKHQLLHIQIKNELLNEYSAKGISENAPFPSERELVRKFKTSKVTIEKVFRELKKDNIIYSIPNLGTFWGRKKNLTRYRTVGVRFNVASLAYITPDSYFFYMLQGIEEVFAKQNLHTKLLRYESLDDVDSIRELNCDALICTGTYLPVLDAVESFKKFNIPYILLDRPNNDESLNYIERDSAKNIEELVDYLADKGHRKICCIGLASKLWIDEKLYIGFASGMKRHGFDFTHSIIKVSEFNNQNFTRGNLKEIIRNHTALMILNPAKDRIKAVLEYCDANMIKIPEDCSIISLAASEMTIENRTVANHLITPHEMGHKAAELIAGLLNNSIENPVHMEFPMRIEEGNTVKVAGKHKC